MRLCDSVALWLRFYLWRDRVSDCWLCHPVDLSMTAWLMAWLPRTFKSSCSFELSCSLVFDTFLPTVADRFIFPVLDFLKSKGTVLLFIYSFIFSFSKMFIEHLLCIRWCLWGHRGGQDAQNFCSCGISVLGNERRQVKRFSCLPCIWQFQTEIMTTINSKIPASDTFCEENKTV